MHSLRITQDVNLRKTDNTIVNRKWATGQSDLLNTTQKTRDGVLRSPLKTGLSLGVPEVLAIPAL
jgi:hypothetical protein